MQSSPESSESTRRALDVQEAALKAVSDEAFHRAIDGKTRELSLLPRVCWLVVKGTAVRVKVNALLCLSKTFHFFQVRAVVDKVSKLSYTSVTWRRRICWNTLETFTPNAHPSQRAPDTVPVSLLTFLEKIQHAKREGNIVVRLEIPTACFPSWR